MGNSPPNPFCPTDKPPDPCSGEEAHQVFTASMTASVLLNPSEGRSVSDLPHGSSTYIDPSYATFENNKLG